jgi:hypothetical protein
MKSKQDDTILNACKTLDTDYIDYGGKISRWADPDGDYFDCSCGCKFFNPIYNIKQDGPDMNFGVCLNPKSQRHGLLTFEHQAGFGCFTLEKIR